MSYWLVFFEAWAGVYRRLHERLSLVANNDIMQGLLLDRFLATCREERSVAFAFPARFRFFSVWTQIFLRLGSFT